MEFLLLKKDTPEWNYIWDWLASHPINEGLEEPSVVLNNGEAWQYLGSYRNDNTVITEFRHRNHPVTNRIEILSLKHEINSDAIEKKFRV